MQLNTPTYVIGISSTSASATLTPQDANQAGLWLYNDSTTSVFVNSTRGATATAAVFPTSATAPLNGKVIGPKAIVQFPKGIFDNFINAIQAVSGTGNLYISVGPIDPS
jgi:hypothetical protein